MNEADPSTNPPALEKCVPGIAQSLGLSALFYLMVGAVASALSILGRFGGVSLDMFSSLLVQQVIAWPLALWAGLRWGRVHFREACPLKRFPVRIVPAIFIATFGTTILLLATATLIPMPEAFKEAMAQGMAESSKPAIFFSVVLLAPLAEELFFRGLVLRGYLGRYSVSKAVWASAVLFALFHLNPWQAVVALPLGLGFAWLFLRTGSLVPGILGHATANFSANYLYPPLALSLGYDTKALEALGNYPPSMLSIGFAMAGVGGLILWWQLRACHALFTLCTEERAM